MKQMVLRFFWYIWGAIVGTTLMVVLLVIWLDLPPPGLVRVELVGQLLHRVAENDPGWTASLLRQEGLESLFRVVPGSGADCAGPDVLGPVRGEGCLRLQQLEQDHPVLRRLLPFLVPLTTGLGASLVVALLLARRFVRPIRRIGDGLAALSEGQLDRRIGPALDRSEPAIADVGRAFDAAAGKLQQLTESRSRLFHDLSHEIRSPLARLQAQTALLRQNPLRLPAMLPRMEGDIARMDHLVGEILTLARIDHAGAGLQPVSIDLIDLLDPILRDAELEGHARGIRVHYHGPETLDLHCDPELLHRALENIIRNALRHSPETGGIAVTVTAAGDAATIVIEDEGEGVEPALLPTIFEAFVRDEAGQGAGLGLAIAAKALRLHGGTIEARNRAEGGLAVCCRLPRTVRAPVTSR